jgi:Family of unknown function (DUF6049)
MRRLLLILPAVLALLTPWPASAETGAQASLTLLQQSPWNGPTTPLDLRLRVSNTGDVPLADLSFSITVETPTISRGEYSVAMRSTAPRTAVVSFPFPEPARTIAPGAAHVFRFQQSLAALSTTALYPIRVDLLSSLQPVATLRTPMVFLVEQPKLPIAFTTTWTLWEPLQLQPDGTLGPGPIETDIALGGRLDRMVKAVAAGPANVALAVSPTVIEELRVMAQGYRASDGQRVRVVPKGQGSSADAARMIDAIAQIAGRKGTQPATMPFGDPSLPALTRAGLGLQIGALVQRGQRDMSDVLGVDPSAHVLRPPLSQIDAASAARAARSGARILLVDGGRIPPPPGLKFSPPPDAPVVAGTRTISAVVPDPTLARDIQTWIGAPTRDAPGLSALAARYALGELATIYLETPGTPHRGAAVLFPERTPADPAFLRDFAQLVRASPWLQPMNPTHLVHSITTDRAPVRLSPQAGPSFPAGYADAFATSRDALARFTSTVRGADALAQRLEDDLLLSLSGAAVRTVPVGTAFLSSVDDTVRHVLKDIQPPPTGHMVTIPSLRGTVVFTVKNGTRYQTRIEVKLVPHGQLTLPEGDRITVVLQPGESSLVQMAVQAQTTGRFPVTVQILAPQGGLIAQSQLIVRSTAYNRLALFVTAGAVVFLLLWWGRRFLPHASPHREDPAPEAIPQDAARDTP